MLFLALGVALGQPIVGAHAQTVFVDVTSKNLPAGVVQGNSMDVRPADIDADGDMDLVVAVEFGRNVILLNDGAGAFTDGSAQLLGAQRPSFDSEDVAIVDFNSDGFLDILFVSEDNQTNELWIFAADQDRFLLETGRLGGITGTSNAMLAQDLTGDGHPDILIGNAGQNRLLVNDGEGNFADESAGRLPTRSDITQDLELGDIDGDGDLDLIVANEDDNRVLLNVAGVFQDQTDARLPLRGPGLEMTREADLGDVDGDGDLDLYFANVRFGGGAHDPRDRLLINDGSGVFVDESESRISLESRNTVDADFADLDGDGDLDIVKAQFSPGRAHVLLNDGQGSFVDATARFMPNVSVDGIDCEILDLNADGKLDLYIANYRQQDRLLLAR